MNFFFFPLGPKAISRFFTPHTDRTDDLFPLLKGSAKLPPKVGSPPSPFPPPFRPKVTLGLSPLKKIHRLFPPSYGATHSNFFPPPFKILHPPGKLVFFFGNPHPLVSSLSPRVDFLQVQTTQLLHSPLFPFPFREAHDNPPPLTKTPKTPFFFFSPHDISHNPFRSV